MQSILIKLPKNMYPCSPSLIQRTAKTIQEWKVNAEKENTRIDFNRVMYTHVWTSEESRISPTGWRTWVTANCWDSNVGNAWLCACIKQSNRQHHKRTSWERSTRNSWRLMYPKLHWGLFLFPSYWRLGLIHSRNGWQHAVHLLYSLHSGSVALSDHTIDSYM